MFDQRNVLRILHFNFFYFACLVLFFLVVRSNGSQISFHRSLRLLMIGDSITLGRGISSNLTDQLRYGKHSSHSWRFSFFQRLTDLWGLRENTSAFRFNAVGPYHRCRGGPCLDSDQFPQQHGALWGSRAEWIAFPPLLRQKARVVNARSGSSEIRFVKELHPKYRTIMRDLMSAFPDVVILLFVNHGGDGTDTGASDLELSLQGLAALMLTIHHRFPATIFNIIVPPWNSSWSRAVQFHACEYAVTNHVSQVIQYDQQLRKAHRKAYAKALHFPMSKGIPPEQCILMHFPPCVSKADSFTNESENLAVNQLVSSNPFTYDGTHFWNSTDAVLGVHVAHQFANIFRPLRASDNGTVTVCYLEGATLANHAQRVFSVGTSLAPCGSIDLSNAQRNKEKLLVLLFESRPLNYVQILRKFKTTMNLNSRSNETILFNFSTLLELRQKLFVAVITSSIEGSRVESDDLVFACNAVIGLPSNCVLVEVDLPNRTGLNASDRTHSFTNNDVETLVWNKFVLERQSIFPEWEPSSIFRQNKQFMLPSVFDTLRQCIVDFFVVKNAKAIQGNFQFEQRSFATQKQRSFASSTNELILLILFPIVCWTLVWKFVPFRC